VDQLIVRFIADAQSGFNTFSSGATNVDYLFDPGLIAQAYQRRAGYNIVETSYSGGGITLLLNTAKAPFNDPLVRQAFNLAINRSQLLQSCCGGNKAFALTTTLDKPGTPFYDPKLTIPKYNQAAGQKLIDQVVAQTGKPIQISLSTFNTAYIVNEMQVVQAQLNQLQNVQVSLDIESPTALVPKLNAGNFQAAWFGAPDWNVPAIDMMPYFLSTSSQNYMRYNNPTVDSALHQLAMTSNRKTQVQLVDTIEAQVLKDVPVIFLLRKPTVALLSKNVRNLKMFYEAQPLLGDVWMTKG
jgi:ABC-type transport system substrate-binding protein